MEPSDSAHRPSRLVVLASGSGSNLQAIIDACVAGKIHGDVVGVLTNRPDAFALTRAETAGIPAETVPVPPGAERAEYDRVLAERVHVYEPNWIVLAGWMRLLSMSFLGEFPERVVNLHPALPGELPGTRAIERAWNEAVAGDRASTGVMVHLVPDEGVDDGPVLATQSVPIDASGTMEAFAASVHAAEHALLISTLAELCAQR